MKLAICARESSLDSQVDQRFGRCACFVVVDPDKEEVIESIPNGAVGAAGGAGPQSAQLVAEHDVEAVALGNVGPNAAAALNAAGIKIFTGIEGTVRDTVAAYREGKLQAAAEPTVSSHFGMKGNR